MGIRQRASAWTRRRRSGGGHLSAAEIREVAQRLGREGALLARAYAAAGVAPFEHGARAPYEKLIDLRQADAQVLLSQLLTEHAKQPELGDYTAAQRTAALGFVQEFFPTYLLLATSKGVRGRQPLRRVAVPVGAGYLDRFPPSFRNGLRQAMTEAFEGSAPGHRVRSFGFERAAFAAFNDAVSLLDLASRNSAAATAALIEVQAAARDLVERVYSEPRVPLPLEDATRLVKRIDAAGTGAEVVAVLQELTGQGVNPGGRAPAQALTAGAEPRAVADASGTSPPMGDRAQVRSGKDAGEVGASARHALARRNGTGTRAPRMP